MLSLLILIGAACKQHALIAGAYGLEVQHTVFLDNLVAQHPLLAVGQLGAANLDLLHIAARRLIGAVNPDGEQRIHEIGYALRTRQRILCQCSGYGTLGCVGQTEDAQSPLAFEPYEQCHQFTRRISALGAVANPRYVVDNHNFAAFVHYLRLDAVHYLTDGLGHGCLGKLASYQQWREGIKLVGVRVGVAKLELLVAQLKVKVYHSPSGR